MLHHCPKTGIKWHSTYGSGASTQEHPLLQLSYPALLSSLEKWISTSEADQWDSPTTQAQYFLYGCAILNHYPVIWDYPLNPELALPNILQHWEKLLKLANTFDSREIDRGEIPSLRLTNDPYSTSLAVLPHYLTSIEEAREDATTRFAAVKVAQTLLRKEEVLQRLLDHPTQRGRAQLAKLLPAWAELAASFPRVMSLRSPYSTEQLPLAEIWKEILRYCVLEDYATLLTGYRLGDIEELVIHCEDNLELGTPYSTYTLRALRKAITTLSDFSWDGTRSSKVDSTMIDLDSLLEEDEAEDAEELGLTPEAAALNSPSVPADPPITKPSRGDFPNTKLYLSALLKWKATL